MYLVGLVAMAAVGALVVHGLRSPRVVAGVAAISVVLVSGAFLAERPTTAGWAARDDLLAHPAGHQVCELRDAVRYCAYPAYRPLIDYWAKPVAGVHRAVPAADWPPIEVSQRAQAVDRASVGDSDLAAVLPDLVPQHGSLVDDGQLHPPLGWNRTGLGELELALQAAARVVGLPLSTSRSGMVCDAAGQARAVTALWLAAQATPLAGRTLQRLATSEMSDLGPVGLGRPYLVLPDFGMPGGVAWGMAEVRVALELASQTAAAVPLVTSPAITTDALLASLRVAGPHPSSARAARRYPGPPPTLGPPCA
ncbi:MAG: hypothetical protein M3N98_04305 [Actinomycetota bacterium]|nr:hypothetical protein [Actinomycetota bacterium]